MKINDSILLKMSSLFLMVWMMTACNDQALQNDPLSSEILTKDMSWIQTKSVLGITLWSADGTKITNTSQLHPDMPYQLKVKSAAPLILKIKLTDGFIVGGFSIFLVVFNLFSMVLLKTGIQIQR